MIYILLALAMGVFAGWKGWPLVKQTVGKGWAIAIFVVVITLSFTTGIFGLACIGVLDAAGFVQLRKEHARAELDQQERDRASHTIQGHAEDDDK